mgnify:CR=1 FL=1|nr:MAG TPA: minor tail protein [Bacteriophage sp.]
MADILLSVGVQTKGDLSEFRKGINELINSVNADPPKVRVGVEVSEKALATFRSQLSKIINGITLSNGAKISLKIAGIGEIGSTAENVTKSLKNISDAAEDAATATDKMSNSVSESSKKQDINAKKEAKAARERVSALKQAYTLLVKMQDVQTNWTKAATGSSRESYEQIGENITILQNSINDFNSGKTSLEDFKSKVVGLIGDFDKLYSNIRLTGRNTQSLGKHFSKLASKFSEWFGVSQAIMFAVRSIKQIVQNVIELDTSMTELKKVTDETDATYDRFLNTAVDRAKSVGASLSDVVSATADFARLGYGIDDASNLADAAIIYKNVGDGIDSINQAAESITSTMQVFGSETVSAMSIVDKFNEVGNNFAITSTGIGEALQRSAAAMSAAGNSLDETIALVAAANTIVQNPESVGTTLKTISMYLRAAKTEAEEAGESTDGMASSVSELRDEILSLTGGKVDIQSAEDEFKSTYQILQELSQVWGSLTDISQANILELIGGKRNANVVSALLENFSVAESALETSANAAGSALAENEKYLASIQGKISQFQASWQALSSEVVSSDLIGGIVDAGRVIVDSIGWIIDALGGFGIALTSIPVITFIKNLKPVSKAFDDIKLAALSTAGGSKSTLLTNTPAIS